MSVTIRKGSVIVSKNFRAIKALNFFHELFWKVLLMVFTTLNSRQMSLAHDFALKSTLSWSKQEAIQ